jgi:hypothetical protein
MDTQLGTLLELPGSYYSCLATTLHCWRDNAKDVFVRFKDLAGSEAAIGCGAHRVPPQPIAGRWRKASECEAFLKRFMVTTDVWQHVTDALEFGLKKRSYYDAVGVAVAGAETAGAAADAAAAAAPRGRGRGRNRGGRGRGAAGMDEMSADNAAHHKESMGKWSRKVIGQSVSRCVHAHNTQAFDIT